MSGANTNLNNKVQQVHLKAYDEAFELLFVNSFSPTLFPNFKFAIIGLKSSMVVWWACFS